MYKKRFTPFEAAAYLGVSEKSLAKWRSTGKHGIHFLKLGTGQRAAVRYEQDALDAFLDRCRKNGFGGVDSDHPLKSSIDAGSEAG